MQFGRTLERIIAQTVGADPRFGPVHFIKIDISDGFYRVQVRAEYIPKLGVSFPSLPNQEPVVAFPLALPMGWTESPPYFCAVTETIADVANERILKGRSPASHHLDRTANTKPPTPKPHLLLRSKHPASVELPPDRNPHLLRRPRFYQEAQPCPASPHAQHR
jgi:hypothetical protein